jgi:hypothetical protein
MLMENESKPSKKSVKTILRYYRSIYRISHEKWYEEALKAYTILKKERRNLMPSCVIGFAGVENRIEPDLSDEEKLRRMLNLSSMLGKVYTAQIKLEGQS